MGFETFGKVSTQNNRHLQESIKGFDRQYIKVKNRKIRQFRAVSPEHKAAYIQKIRRQGFYQKILLGLVCFVIVSLTVWLMSLM
jgi:hypothetical protein